MEELPPFRLSEMTGALSCINGIYDYDRKLKFKDVKEAVYELQGDPSVTFRFPNFWMYPEFIIACVPGDSIEGNSGLVKTNTVHDSCKSKPGSIRILDRSTLSDVDKLSVSSSFKAEKSLRLIYGFERSINEVRKSCGGSKCNWTSIQFMVDFKSEEATFLKHVQGFAAVTDASPFILSMQRITEERRSRAHIMAAEATTAAEQRFSQKSPEHVALELQRDDAIESAATARDKIEDLRRQLQKEEENLKFLDDQIRTHNDSISSHVSLCKRSKVEATVQIHRDRETSIAITNMIGRESVADLNRLAGQAAQSQALLVERIAEIHAERRQWRSSVCIKSAAEVGLFDMQRLFAELDIPVDKDAISRTKLNGNLLVSEDLDEDDLMEALALKSLKSKLVLRHLRQAVASRTLAFTLADVDVDNALTWCEDQVVGWLQCYRGEESLKFLEEACRREHLNGIAVLQIDKECLKTTFGLAKDVATLAAALRYIREIRISPGSLSQMLQQPVLTMSRSIEPPSTIKLLNVDLGAPFANFVLARMRGDVPNFRVSRVSRVCVDKIREDAFCSMVDRECSSRQANSKLRPSNFVDPASVAGLEALKHCFETSSHGQGSACNVAFAWHGPPSEHVEAVCRDNPRSFRTTDGGFFGAGSYFALEINYASRYAMLKPPNPSGEYGVILFAVMVASAYVVTPDRDYHDGPQHPSRIHRNGFSRFYSPEPESSIALMPGYSSHFVPVKFCGQVHAVSGVHLPYDTDYQAALENQASTRP
jgi:hypothetical protein